jgi:hypothetical protein
MIITCQQLDLQYQHLMEMIDDIYKLLHYKVPLKKKIQVKKRKKFEWMCQTC